MKMPATLITLLLCTAVAHTATAALKGRQQQWPGSKAPGVRQISPKTAGWMPVIGQALRHLQRTHTSLIRQYGRRHNPHFEVTSVEQHVPSGSFRVKFNTVAGSDESSVFKGMKGENASSTVCTGKSPSRYST